MMNPDAFIKQYATALATQSWPTIAPLMHDDVCVTFSDGTYQGKTAVQQAFERTFSLIKEEEYAIANLVWVRKTEEMAVCLFTFHWRGIIHGEMAQGSGRGTSVLIHEEGRWQLLTEHLGPNAQS